MKLQCKDKKRLALCISIISTLLMIAFICLLHYQKRDGFHEIRKGNFSVINGIEESERSALETVWQEQKEEDDMEWVLFDLNEDGVEELIWRDKELPERALKRIVAVFSKNSEGAWLVWLDTTDDTEYYVLENENYIYYQQYSEPYRYFSIKDCRMNENFELIGYSLYEAFLIPAYDLGQGKAEEKWAADLEEQYPFISGEGNYFREIDTQPQTETLLSKGDWTRGVERMTGTLLEDIDPELYSLIFTGDAIITEKEINPYSTETFIGFCMYDIFEANRGAYTGFDRCADEGFEYHREFSPWQWRENPLTWDIQLAKMKESEALADVFNEYHEKLFEEKKAEMERRQEELKKEYREQENKHSTYFGDYTSNMRTMACFYWGDFFSVVDMGDTFHSGTVNAVPANFNTSSGKQYRLKDLFAVENYKEYLLGDILEILLSEEEEWGLWLENWKTWMQGEESETSFLITYRGLMLIDNRYRQKVLLIEWEKLEDILSEEAAELIPKTGEAETAEEAEKMSEIADIITGDGYAAALCEDGSVWYQESAQDGDQETGCCTDDFQKIEGLNHVTKIMAVNLPSDDSPMLAVYALDSAGDVYVWKRNVEERLDPEAGKGDTFNKPAAVKGISDVTEIDARSGKIFVIDKEGVFYAWGWSSWDLPLYYNDIDDEKPGFPEESRELAGDVKKVFTGAGDYHYFIREDGSVFSIMVSTMDFSHIDSYIFPDLTVTGDETDLSYEEKRCSDVELPREAVQIDKGAKFGKTILYEMGDGVDIEKIAADKYTMYMIKTDGTLWYWNSDKIKYQDEKNALLDSRGRVNRGGKFITVAYKELLGQERGDTADRKVVDLCAGKENALFLTDSGQVFISKYITTEIKDVECYDASPPKLPPYQMDRTYVSYDMPLKALSFERLDYENIVHINTDGAFHFSLLDDGGDFFDLDMSGE